MTEAQTHTEEDTPDKSPPGGPVLPRPKLRELPRDVERIIEREANEAAERAGPQPMSSVEHEFLDALLQNLTGETPNERSGLPSSPAHDERLRWGWPDENHREESKELRSSGQDLPDVSPTRPRRFPDFIGTVDWITSAECARPQPRPAYERMFLDALARRPTSVVLSQKGCFIATHAEETDGGSTQQTSESDRAEDMQVSVRLCPGAAREPDWQQSDNGLTPGDFGVYRRLPLCIPKWSDFQVTHATVWDALPWGGFRRRTIETKQCVDLNAGRVRDDFLDEMHEACQYLKGMCLACHPLRQDVPRAFTNRGPRIRGSDVFALEEVAYIDTETFRQCIENELRVADQVYKPPDADDIPDSEKLD